MKSILTTGIFAILACHSLKFSADTATAGGGTATAPEPVEESQDPAAPKSSPVTINHPIIDTVEIELKKLVIDAGTQPRVAIDEETVKEYAETIKRAVKDEQPIPFPPVTVFRDPQGRCVLADGFHRYAAHKEAKVKEILCEIREGTERDALLFACGANTTHGVRRTNKDKQRAVKIVLNDPEWQQWANTEIARICGVSEFMVRDLRPAAKTPTTRKQVRAGKVTTIQTAAIGKGKGGGAKGAKEAAKSASKNGNGKSAASEPAKGGSKSQQDNAQELDTHLRKIAEAVGGDEGGKIRKAVHDGALELSLAEVRAWAGFAPKDIKNIAPLVTGGARMKPTKAFDFVKSELPEKIVTDLHNRALGNGGKYTYETESVKVVVTHVKKA